MRSSTVVMLDVDAQHALEMTAGHDQQPVEALLPDRPHPSLRHRVGPECSVGGVDHLDAFSGKDLIEGGGELGVSVVDHEAHRRVKAFQADAEVAGLLGDPGAIGVGGAAAEGARAG
jgi:hypothetical protein